MNQSANKTTSKPKSASKPIEVEDGDKYSIENSSDEDDQFSLDDALNFVGESTAEYQNTSKPKPSVSSKVSPNSNPSRNQNPVGSRNYSNDSTLIKTTTDADNRPSRTILSYFPKPTASGESQEKRPRSTLLESLDEDYHRKSPAKIKRNSESYAKIVLPTPKCELVEEIDSKTAFDETVIIESKSTVVLIPELQVNKEDGDERQSQDSVIIVDSEMSEDSEKTVEFPTNIIADVEQNNRNPQAVTATEQEKVEYSPSPKKGIDKSRLMFESYFNVKKVSNNHKGVDKPIDKDPEKTSSNQNLPIAGTDSMEPNSEAQNVTDKFYSEQLNSQLNSETDHFKALHVASQCLAEDIDGRKSPNDMEI